jgi:hypothetical protein
LAAVRLGGGSSSGDAENTESTGESTSGDPEVLLGAGKGTAGSVELPQGVPARASTLVRPLGGCSEIMGEGTTCHRHDYSVPHCRIDWFHHS